MRAITTTKKHPHPSLLPDGEGILRFGDFTKLLLRLLAFICGKEKPTLIQHNISNRIGPIGKLWHFEYIFADGTMHI